MKSYRPKGVLLVGDIPLSQCLCDYCENGDLCCKALTAAGLKSIPANKYKNVEATLCTTRLGRFGTTFKFPPLKCIKRECDKCGTEILKKVIEQDNEDLLKTNKVTSWHEWKTLPGHLVLQKVQTKENLKRAFEIYLKHLDFLSHHLFRSTWNRNIFEYMKGNLRPGYVLQVMDFAMNFNNCYQDKIQQAYWDGTQTTIHATINFMLCPEK